MRYKIDGRSLTKEFEAYDMIEAIIRSCEIAGEWEDDYFTGFSEPYTLYQESKYIGWDELVTLEDYIYYDNNGVYKLEYIL